MILNKNDAYSKLNMHRFYFFFYQYLTPSGVFAGIIPLKMIMCSKYFFSSNI